MDGLPEGIVPNYVDPPDHIHQSIVLHTIVIILVTLAVAMRFWTRLTITKSFGLDDWMTLFAYAATVSWSGVLIASGNFGIGRHIWDIPPEWLITGLKFLFVTQLMYIVIVLAVKMSFFLCFDRIFGSNRRVKYFIWFGMASNIIFYAVVFFRTLFLCKPFALSWNPYLEGECGSEDALPYATGVWGFISDFYILILPMPCVWGLNMKTSKKAKLMAAFSVGLFACIASIVRFVFTLRLVQDGIDATWNYIDLSVWAVIEIDVGLICSCLLAFPAFFEKHKPAKWDSYASRFSSYIARSRGTRSGSYSNSNEAVAKYGNGNGGRHYSELDQLPLHQKGNSNGRNGSYYQTKVARS